MAIIGLVVGIGALTKAQEKNAAKFKEMSDEIAAANFELSQTNKKVDDIISSLEELNGLSFLTAEQKKEIQDLEEALGEVIPEKYLKRNIVTGQIDYEDSKEGIATFRQSNIDDARAGSKDLAMSAIKNGKKGANQKWFNSGDFLVTNAKANIDTDLEKKALVDYYMGIYADANEDLTAEQADAYRRFLENSVENDMDGVLGGDDPSKTRWGSLNDMLEIGANDFIERTQETSEYIRDAQEKLADEELSFMDGIEAVRELNANATTEQREILEQEYGTMLAISKEFNKKQLELMEGVGLNNAVDIQKGVEIYGDKLTDILKGVQVQADILISSGIGSTQAYSMA